LCEHHTYDTKLIIIYFVGTEEEEQTVKPKGRLRRRKFMDLRDLLVVLRRQHGRKRRPKKTQWFLVLQKRQTHNGKRKARMTQRIVVL